MEVDSLSATADYCSLSAATFDRDQLPDATAERLSHDLVPAAVRGRSTVDQRYQGRG